MNPKDMTNDELVAIVENPSLCFASHEDELLRRLDEANALRKENEELRKFLDTDAAGRPLYVLLHDAWSVADNGPLADCLHERSVALEAIDYDALNARIESAKQKEASHE